MSDSSSKINSGSIWKAIEEVLSISFLGLRQINYKSWENILPATLGTLLLFTICIKDKYLRLASNLGIYDSQSLLWRILESTNWIVLFVFTLLSIVAFIGFIIGLVPYIKRKRLQKKLDTIGLSNAQSERPFAIKEIEIDENKSKLLLSATGIGLEKFQAKKGDIESAFQTIVEGIEISGDRKTIQILMCKRELRKVIDFSEAEVSINKDYHFIVGDTANGILTVDIRELPHLLIAGSTGGGKSVFFRSVFTCLLKYSKNLQVYLIDLKNGVEVREFENFPNVKVAKNEQDAVQILELILEEMKRRFHIMETRGIKKIDPKAHKLDLIVVGIDEASVLFGKTKASKTKELLVTKAREITDEIAKLSRAAGIHLILATQKPVKDSIDTKVMENLTGRMVFKMSTHAGSNAALGNAKAFNLPDIKGRGIWSGGNKFIEVQAPYLDEKEFERECKELEDSLGADEDLLFGKMLDSQSAITDSIDEVEDNYG